MLLTISSSAVGRFDAKAIVARSDQNFLGFKNLHIVSGTARGSSLFVLLKVTGAALGSSFSIIFSKQPL